MSRIVATKKLQFLTVFQTKFGGGFANCSLPPFDLRVINFLYEKSGNILSIAILFLHPSKIRTSRIPIRNERRNNLRIAVDPFRIYPFLDRFRERKSFDLRPLKVN